jgi:hypothetical protein
MAANDYYDFNPSPTTWSIMLSVFVLFVVALSLLLILMVHRGEASGPVQVAQPEPQRLPGQPPRSVDSPTSKAS